MGAQAILTRAVQGVELEAQTCTRDQAARNK